MSIKTWILAIGTERVYCRVLLVVLDMLIEPLELLGLEHDEGGAQDSRHDEGVDTPGHLVVDLLTKTCKSDKKNLKYFIPSILHSLGGAAMAQWKRLDSQIWGPWFKSTSHCSCALLAISWSARVEKS